MDALMASLVLGALCQAGDRTPWLAAVLADRYRRPGTVALAASLALAANYALGAVGGILLAPMLSANARLVLLALALILAGLGTPLRNKSPDRLEGWRLGPWWTSALGLAIMAFGDRMQFVAAALAARSAVPWLAAVGATLGALAVTLPAAYAGEARWLALPQRTLRVGSAVVLVVAGLWVGLSGLALI